MNLLFATDSFHSSYYTSFIQTSTISNDKSASDVSDVIIAVMLFSWLVWGHSFEDRWSGNKIYRYSYMHNE